MTQEALKLAFQTLELSKETMESACKQIDELKAENKALKEALAQAEPFGYFKTEPFGWTDCAETDEGAIALYQATPQRTWVGLDWLPEHKCGLHLSHNEHRDVYETIEDFYDPEYFVSEEEWLKAVAEDSVWVLHWYPNTPVGFNRIAASTLEAIEAAHGIKK